MNQDKFERMMAKWAEKEQQSIPELRPTPDMYRKVKAKRQRLWFPLFNRWATLGVAAIALIVSILVLRPQFFQSSKEAEPIVEKKQLAEESLSEDLVRKEAPRPAAPPESEAPLQDREKVIPESEPRVPKAQEGAGIELGSSASGSKDRTVSLAKKEDRPVEERALPEDKQALPPVVANEAPKTAPAPVPVRRDTRSQAMPHDRLEMDEAVAAKSAKPQAVPVPERRKGRALRQEMFADDMKEQEESNVGILSLAGRDGDNALVKTFELRDGVWVDREYDAENAPIAIKRDSAAFDDLLAARPDLKSYTDRYYHLIINLGAHSIEISGSGKSELSPEELHTLVQ